MALSVKIGDDWGMGKGCLLENGHIYILIRCIKIKVYDDDVVEGRVEEKANPKRRLF